MKKKKQNFTKLNKTKVAKLTKLVEYNILGGTNAEITDSCGDTDTGGQGNGRTDHILCNGSDPQVTNC